MNTIQNELPAFKTILVATDFSAYSMSAFTVSVRIATSLHARLLVLHVFEHSDTILECAGGEAFALEELVRSAQLQLEDLRGRAQQAELEVEPLLEYGVPSPTILNVITARKVDLAVVATKGVHGLKRGLFGSTAETVLRKAGCPVVTVGPRVPPSIGQSQRSSPVIFATDFNAASSHVVRYAISLCQQMGAPLHCLDVLPQSMAETGRDSIIPHILTNALHQIVDQSGCMLDHAVYAMTYGDEVPAAIVNYAKQQNAGFIVLGVKRAPAIASHLPAHIAYGVIAESACPVLTLSFE